MLVKFSAGALALVLAVPAWAGADTLCTAQTVRRATDVTEICACRRITTDALDVIRRARNLPRILGALDASCPALALLVTEVPTAAIRPGAPSDSGPGTPGGGTPGGNPGGGTPPTDPGDGDPPDDDPADPGPGDPPSNGRPDSPGNGTHANNGGGNGGEGSSPGRGHGANDDES